MDWKGATIWLPFLVGWYYMDREMTVLHPITLYQFHMQSLLISNTNTPEERKCLGRNLFLATLLSILLLYVDPLWDYRGIESLLQLSMHQNTGTSRRLIAETQMESSARRMVKGILRALCVKIALNRMSFARKLLQVLFRVYSIVQRFDVTHVSKLECAITSFYSLRLIDVRTSIYVTQ